MVVDEGGLGLVSLPGGHTVYALPSTSEKGYLDIKVTVKAQGGHSSEPPDHTGIGIMSALVGRLEDRPHQPNLTAENPMMQWLYCLASDPALDDITRQYIFEAAYSQQGRDKLAHRIVTFFPQYRSAITTTQAADVIEGGVKANALPEEVTLTINHRLALHDSIEELKTHIFHLFLPVAERFDLPLHAYSGVSPHEHGIYLEALSPLEPAPISTFKSEAWSKVGGLSCNCKTKI